MSYRIDVRSYVTGGFLVLAMNSGLRDSGTSTHHLNLLVYALLEAAVTLARRRFWNDMTWHARVG